MAPQSSLRTKHGDNFPFPTSHDQLCPGICDRLDIPTACFVVNRAQKRASEAATFLRNAMVDHNTFGALLASFPKQDARSFLPQ